MYQVRWRWFAINIKTGLGFKAIKNRYKRRKRWKGKSDEKKQVIYIRQIKK